MLLYVLEAVTILSVLKQYPNDSLKAVSWPSLMNITARYSLWPACLCLRILAL